MMKELLSDEGIENYLLEFYSYSQYLESENLWKNDSTNDKS